MPPGSGSDIFRPWRFADAISAEALRKQAADRKSGASVCSGAFGMPMAGLFSEPIKIVQAPRLTLVLYEVDHYEQLRKSSACSGWLAGESLITFAHR